ncbi:MULTISPECIES: hypothetical protein [unclassified Bradyrhizobium]|uniref:hypothetical protein n=1 Tax=unclassified Bradyrhizobium TaxID=2631580 RepID=UPI0011614E4F|nr:MULTISPECIES: hypothetical protein [unclassified Bradyrhizobium]
MNTSVEYGQESRFPCPIGHGVQNSTAKPVNKGEAPRIRLDFCDFLPAAPSGAASKMSRSTETSWLAIGTVGFALAVIFLVILIETFSARK